MLAFRIATVAPFALFAILLGGPAVAWRRASVSIAHTLAISRSIRQGAVGVPTLRELTDAEIMRFTPRWVSARHVLALVVLALTFLLALMMFSWYVAIGVLVATYILMELAGSLFPNRRDPYYVRRVYNTFYKQLAVARRFNDAQTTSDMEERIREIQETYATYLKE